jgi:hypothetical protein
MNPHIFEDLPRLLTGEAAQAETLAAAEHLRGCPDCQQELVSAVVAHASLVSARRFAPELAAPEQRPAGAEEPGRPPPDLTAMFAQARSEANATAPKRRHRRMLAAAAAAVVMAGVGVTIAETLGSSGPAHPGAQAITLAPVGPRHAAAKATIGNGAIRIDATALPKLSGARQYEVWLADSTGQQVRPVGYVGADRTADLPVPRPVASRYSYVAISIQKTEQVAFSGDMVARGFYG